MSIKLLTEHHLRFLILKGGCTGSSESTLVKMPHCWKSHALAQIELEKEDLPVAHINNTFQLEWLGKSKWLVKAVIIGRPLIIYIDTSPK